MTYKFSLAASSLVIAAATLPAPVAAQELYIGEIIQTGYNFCPRNTMEAAGQLLSISQNSALFALYGTTYGGNGSTTFGLPDLRGRAPIGQGNGSGLTPRPIGQMAGTETTTLTTSNLPPHNHTPQVAIARVSADQPNPINNSFARAAQNAYTEQAPGTDLMHQGTIVSSNVGQGVPVNNMQPFQVMRYCVALYGIFPSRN
ncbi:phage tail protein [Alteriqipengyuania lutimaris]|uniref:Phage tail protein n=1 Tax=Alteriqipengyuania lutimaris TaxID=1538146 RepID=A0A395LGE1_9SPHN|nr:tail fiber protein [Alteriqipengyuania lutimaris]MBB3035232.1 microcystin-dependent protein [Alteriqipengyuania lutimaris]RDS75833.1 phage tail protein [Alteriqipengyuania lutimaris]